MSYAFDYKTFPKMHIFFKLLTLEKEFDKFSFFLLSFNQNSFIEDKITTLTL